MRERHTATVDVFLAFLRLGLTSFGGPVAHLGYFRGEFVGRRRWLDDAAFGDIVALCQFLPGPASSQTGIALGLMRAGLPGAFAAFPGFTAPSAVLMILFAYGVVMMPGIATNSALHGLKIVAVAVVAQALIAMARSLTPDLPRITVALAAGAIAILAPTTLGQVAVILFGAVAGGLLLKGAMRSGAALDIPVSPGVAMSSLVLFFLLLAGLPALAWASGNHMLAVTDAFYRAGALVFGGGHVVLPLLQAAVVPSGWVSNDDFLAGYGAAQAMPGPLFTFAAFLGTAMREPPNGWFGGCICLAAIFLPSFLLVFGALPLWNRLRADPRVQSILAGINAAVVGLLGAAFYNPVWLSGITSQDDLAFAIAAFALLQIRMPQWVVVLLGAAAGSLLGL